jgi:hypothetical protein
MLWSRRIVSNRLAWPFSRAKAGRLVFALLWLASVVAVSCAEDSTSASPTPAPAGGNLLLNPSLEDGDSPWREHTAGVNPNTDVHFTLAQNPVHSGQASAQLRMRDGQEAEGARVYYLVQEIEPEEFPEVVRGFYRVEHWEKGTPKQYLQFVVIVFSPGNLDPVYANYQIRYPLAGIDSEPFRIDNAHFVFKGTEEPSLGEWVPFEANVLDDFQRLWGTVPADFDRIRVLFEVRYDAKEPGQVSEADVYYDDLYVGPATES